MTNPTPEPDDEVVSRHVLDDNDNDNFEGSRPPGRYHLWWAMHAPETYALSALIFAILSTFGFVGPSEFISGLQVGHRLTGADTPDIYSGIHAALAVVAILLAARSVVLEDDDATWSTPVARSAILVGALALLFGIASLIAAHTGANSGPNPFLQ